MNEYELVDVLRGMASNSMAAQALFFTALSAYLFVTYAIGKKLWRGVFTIWTEAGT